MKTSNQILLAETEQGVPSGNYDGSSLAFSSDRVKAVGYYKSTSTSQTIRFQSNDFVGSVKLYATLDSDPDENIDWFNAYTFPGDSAIDGSTAITTDYSITLHGNFTWIKATVENFDGGTIGPITITY